MNCLLCLFIQNLESENSSFSETINKLRQMLADYYSQNELTNNEINTLKLQIVEKLNNISVSSMKLKNVLKNMINYTNIFILHLNYT